MSANFSTIKAGIKAILEADTDLNQTGQVFDYEPPRQSVTKDPFVIVIASDNEADFGNTIENKRIYGFKILIHVERKERGESAAESLLVDIIDRVINALDQNSTLSVSGVLMVKASPSSWAYLVSDKEYRVAEIRVQAMVWFDTTP